MSARRRRLLYGIGLSAVALTGIAWMWWTSRPGDERAPAEARNAHSAGGDATSASRTLLDDAAAMLNTGDARSATARLEQLPPELPESVHQKALQVGDLFRDRGRLSAAESLYRRVLQTSSDDVEAHERLGHVLALEGRGSEAAPHLVELFRQNRPSVFGLFLLGDSETYFFPRTEVETYVAQAPDDPMAQLAMAQVDLALGNTADAERRLQDVTRAHSESAEAQAMLGLVLLDHARDDEFLNWNRDLPAVCETHPDVWVARGLWARKQDDLTGAARCFWEALRRQPDHRRALTQLGQLLLAVRPADAAVYQTRADQLQRLRDIVIELHKQYPKFTPAALQLIREAAELCESLGRLWEAGGWSLVALQLDPTSTWPRELLTELKPRLSENLPQIVRDSHPAWAVELASLSLPSLPRGAESDQQPAASVASMDNVRFEEDATASGIEFTYFNSADPATEGARIFETTGGGVAALDFDSDHWPDLLLTQGCPFPFESEQRTYLDRLYRNLSGRRFADVTASAGIVEGGFSQGASAGDLNDDGFPDLLVANLGRNRVFSNNGDGTFSDITDEAGIGGDDWTTSVAIADVNGDGISDVVEVNYLAGPEIFNPPCLRDGKQRVCHPNSFPPAQSRLLLGDGEGRFRDVTDESHVSPFPRNGLGIVVADLAGSPQLDLFIAADMQPNLFFVNDGEREGTPNFIESAAAVGLAYDQDGNAQACMGIAAGDADGDRLIDLFVTNFLRESNTLYAQQPKGLFNDATRQSGLAEPSLNMLGFGTQFLDAELDGWPDLVVANGHIDDFTFRGDPFKMRPQFFSNRSEGRFEEVEAEKLDPWFATELLGRGLAVLDWNRDGREDFAVSHIDAPAALLTNCTSPVGRLIAIQLRGTQSARDAIGATVDVTSGDRTWTRQLTAGDGYQASNERRLVFGLGELTRIDSLTIRWPSGVTQSVTVSETGSDWLIIEGRSNAMRLDR